MMDEQGGRSEVRASPVPASAQGAKVKHWTIKVAVDAGRDIVIEINSVVAPRETVELLASRGVWRDDDFWYPPNRIVYVTLQEAQPQPTEGHTR